MNTTQIAKIMQAIKADKELSKAINKVGWYSVEAFIDTAERYINAIKDGRMIVSIGSVSQSGMSRTMKFLECSHNKQAKRYNYLNFFAFFKALGHTEAKNMHGYFRVNGCGMDMVFATNYNIIHKLHNLGFITKEQCASLAQSTPSVI